MRHEEHEAPGQQYLLREGKAKRILQDVQSFHNVIVEAKDVMKAGDGRIAPMPGKAELITQMACDSFALLEQNGVETHFIERVSPTAFRAKKLTMVQVECVARRLAYGSYLKRHTDIPEKTRFDSITTELFFKDDLMNDPLLLFNSATQNLELHDQKTPLGDGFMREISQEQIIPDGLSTNEVLYDLHTLTSRTFQVLEQAWQAQNATLVDLKIECGYDENGNLVVGDTIDADGWRVWVAGDVNQAVDRQNLYHLAVFNPNDIEDTLTNYRRAAQMTSLFIPLAT